MSHPPGSRPKRTTNPSSFSSPSSAAPHRQAKKPRFDARNPSTLAADDDGAEDADDRLTELVLDADVIGKGGAGTKRNAVRIEGYESDSDNDNFDARARRKREGEKGKGSKEEEEEDEDDMFADLAAKEDGGVEGDGEGKRKDREVRFLDAREIEGQVMNSTSGGRVSANLLLGGKGRKQRGEEAESESSSDEEERDRLDEEMEDDLAAEIGAGGKKKHAPRLDAFNLRAEEEEGRYDESGNYVRKAMDPDSVNDNWLDGLSKKDLKRAKEAHEKREDERRRKAIEDDAVLTSDILSTLITHLDTGESPLEALQRLNKGKAKTKTKETKVPKWKQKKQKDKMDVDEHATNGDGSETSIDPQEEARKKAVEAITGAADALYSRGQHEIYEAERELLMRQYRRETDEDWTPPKSHEGPVSTNQTPGAAWEYRWSDARDGGESHGPYDGATMQAWNEAGYFGEGVEFRQVEGGAWSTVLNIS